MKKSIEKIGAAFASLALALCLTACNNSNTSNSGISAPSLIQSGSTTSSSVNSTGATSLKTSSSSEKSSAAESVSGNSSETSVIAESSEPEQSKTEPVSSKPNAPVESEPAPSEPQNGKTLVVYFSASGNTKAAAELIAAKTNGDLFEIVPKEPYTSADLDWTNKDSRVSREHDDVSLRDMELENVSAADWESYDTVFIGYPIWWGIAAWAVDPFIKANDFSGKTVIPFCTSASSGLGDSGKLLAEEADTGNWLDGQRFASRPSESDVNDWLDGLGM